MKYLHRECLVKDRRFMMVIERLLESGSAGYPHRVREVATRGHSERTRQFGSMRYGGLPDVRFVSRLTSHQNEVHGLNQFQQPLHWEAPALCNADVKSD